jgi:hypothetical protein
MTRKPRPPLPPTERPLDDGPRNGTELWREVQGIMFCHWDRWLLRLALAEPTGLAALAHEFEHRRTHRDGRDAAEALLAQVRDLEARLARVGRTPATLLDATEQASEWLRKKAVKRVLESPPHAYTRAMRETPRRVLDARALRGHWPELPVSPAPFEAALGPVGVMTGYAEWWATAGIAEGLDFEIERIARTTACDDERLALYRAAITVLIETMARVDDSGADISRVFEGVERMYLPLARAAAARPGILRDLLELVVWEDYGLFQHAEDFLRALPEPLADMALRELREIIAELHREGLDYPLDKARRLRRAVVASADGLALEDEPDADSRHRAETPRARDATQTQIGLPVRQELQLAVVTEPLHATEDRQLALDKQTAYGQVLADVRREGQIQLVLRQFAKRLQRELTTAERTALLAHIARLGPERVGDLVIERAPEALLAWLNTPEAS